MKIIKQILELEARNWNYASEKDRYIYKYLNITPVKYYLILGRILDSSEGDKTHPLIVDHLRNIRNRRLMLRMHKS